MSDFYEERASDLVSAANAATGVDVDGWLRDACEEVAAELLSLSRACREVGA